MKHTQPATDPALVLDIMAQLFASGSSLAAGLAAVGKHLPGCQPLTKVARLLLLGLDWDTAWTHADDIPQLNQLAEELRCVNKTEFFRPMIELRHSIGLYAGRHRRAATNRPHRAVGVA